VVTIPVWTWRTETTCLLLRYRKMPTPVVKISKKATPEIIAWLRPLDLVTLSSFFAMTMEKTPMIVRTKVARAKMPKITLVRRIKVLVSSEVLTFNDLAKEFSPVGVVWLTKAMTKST